MACGTADSLVWEILKFENCCFRVKTDTLIFCRNEDNVTGICDRKSCSLANSQYGTVMLEKGKLILKTKTAERAHMPSKMWQKIELPENPEEAYKIIEYEMQYWDAWLIEKVKFRYGRLLETLQNMREMRKKEGQVKSLPIKKKIERRNATREQRALNVAHVEYSVQEELKRRLKAGEYGEIYNLNQAEFQDNLDELAGEEEEVDFVDASDFEELVEEEEEEVLENAQ
ncbi:Mak16 protein [Trichomonas vaginalis G3]|uniref:Protein MAK16 homolog n=1 Tax=Trichomonas vaginalis (strain ATCC PRA-98 / G3) TaxID=412133 RepID=A2EFY5_TRIV3|nr:maturation of LSU-rRNA [Trichomonas vaginalis G3]EAY08441.1 Mak16 protein [Trichomonas vaginalis G3]KAI5518127.1 maturation of LSU-rRNA [Trichomonas vaginalis G3]|eukprot:XP_001320664.1 Mak16 protein [Trichomonas vaginalis G3]